MVIAGNLEVRVGVDDSLFATPKEVTFEAATKAVESIVGTRDFEDGEDIVAIYDSGRRNIFELEENEVAAEDYEPQFGILILVHEDSKKKTIPTYHHLASKVFSNAAMPDMVEYSLKAEKENPDIVAEFNKLENNN